MVMQIAQVLFAIQAWWGGGGGGEYRIRQSHF